MGSRRSTPRESEGESEGEGEGGRATDINSSLHLVSRPPELPTPQDRGYGSQTYFYTLYYQTTAEYM
ncbi:hypothetical protein E2C01_003113 [Portunus trituberculatus]|uniref:Uncharacterized protein n=1 Tax=Portunus trituberculatus TaxID=210409 RepID=A0A5B7CQ57_PORTR|nr:hypothetical protein [Portunus trituberculatus]